MRALINIRCTKCGAAGIGTCNCWTMCLCGWNKETGKPCGNPNCTERGRVDAMLKHSRKRGKQRANKPIAKHAGETLAKRK